MTPPMNRPSDLEIMELADGESDDPYLVSQIEGDPESRAKARLIQQMGELVRGHLELSADAVHDAKFAAMWRRIDGQLVPPVSGLWSRISAWFDRYRSHIITGAVSAGAVAALALVLRPGVPDPGQPGSTSTIIVRPVALRANPEIDALDTPGASSTVINLDDDDSHAAVIWVTPDDSNAEEL